MNGLIVLDINEPDFPELVGDLPASGFGQIDVYSQYVFVAAEEEGVYVVDLSDPTRPIQVAEINTPGSAVDVAVSDGILYIANYENGLLIYDVQDPVSPIELGVFETNRRVQHIDIEGSLAYITGFQTGLLIVDVSDASKPLLVNSWSYQGDHTASLDVVGSLAYITMPSTNDLLILNVDNPMSPVLMDTVSVHDTFRSIEVVGNRVYVTNDAYGLMVYDVSDSFNAILLGYYSNELDYSPRVVAVDGGVAYVYEVFGRLDSIDVSSPSRVSVATFGIDGFDFDIEDNVVYIASDRGLNIYDASDIDSIQPISFYGLAGFAIGVVVDSDRAYISHSSMGLLVLDVSDSKNPTLMGSYSPVAPGAELVIVGDVLYLTNTNGLAAIDVSSPETPKLLWQFETEGFARGLAIVGGLAYITDSMVGMLALDISESNVPSLVGTYVAPGESTNLYFADGVVYVVDEDFGVHSVDVSDPESPVYLSTYTSPGKVRDVHVVNDIAYITDYFRSYLQVLDLSDPYSPIQLGLYNGLGNLSSIEVSGDMAYVLQNDNLPYNRGGVNILNLGECAGCVVDLNEDSTLDYLDVMEFISLLQLQSPRADLTQDGSYNFLDISAFIAEFASGCP
tara:strand:+ start:5226 stop:7088 length:1863 start_codon:yes stop_codon:yes gene_type:complete